MDINKDSIAAKVDYYTSWMHCIMLEYATCTIA